jgi:D-proline reductase (dithiol) PrdB
VGLVARALELAGVATTLTSWNGGVTRLTMPPRATFTRLARGATLGRPGDIAQQRRILEATLALLGREAPIEPVQLDERMEP